MMSPQSNEVEKKARAVEDKIPQNETNSQALQTTIESAELYLRALRLTESPKDRKRLDSKCKELLRKAEHLKSIQDESKLSKLPHRTLNNPTSTRELTTRENIILLEGSKLNGLKFKPWIKPPSDKDFALINGHDLFSDPSLSNLSPKTQAAFAGWERPREALSKIKIIKNEEHLANEPCMCQDGNVDLVQDMTSDCSVVASLCATTSRSERGYPNVFGTIFWPYNYENDHYLLSPNGKYIFRFYFNGCWRQVEIDDHLPSSKSSRLLHVIDRSHPGLLWPALLEKAYLKVRGGYDFPGSNSGTDLAVLTGWIPQQIFLHHQGIEKEKMWFEIKEAFQEGNVLLTLGTGKLARQEQKQLGLAAEHDYAVLNISDENDVQEMLIKNPWADGEVWKGAVKSRPNSDQDSTSSNAHDESSDTMMPGTFWMNFDNVLQYFENMYLNWNPNLFEFREEMHFSWDLSERQISAGIFVENPQFTITSQTGGQQWLLLSRHFTTGDKMRSADFENAYISLYVFARCGQQILSSDGAQIRGPFVDSPNTLLRFEIPQNDTYTVVVASQGLQPKKHNFTLSVLSRSPTKLKEVEPKYNHKHTITSAWSQSSAGGNMDGPDYLINPQFRFTIYNEQKVTLVLRLAKQTSQVKLESALYVKILLISSDGSRISKLRWGDVVTHSGDYQSECAVIETLLSAGTYVAVCSTFEKHQYASFYLDFYSSISETPHLAQIPSESSGRLSLSPPAAVFYNDVNRLLIPITLARITKAIFIARQNTAAYNSSLFKMTLEQGQGPYKEVIATSGTDLDEYQDLSKSLRINDLDLHPSLHGPGTGGLWLVLERLGQNMSGSNVEEIVSIEILVEERVHLGPWGIGDG